MVNTGYSNPFLQFGAKWAVIDDTNTNVLERVQRLVWRDASQRKYPVKTLITEMPDTFTYDNFFRDPEIGLKKKRMLFVLTDRSVCDLTQIRRFVEAYKRNKSRWRNKLRGKLANASIRQNLEEQLNLYDRLVRERSRLYRKSWAWRKQTKLQQFDVALKEQRLKMWENFPLLIRWPSTLWQFFKGVRLRTEPAWLLLGGMGTSFDFKTGFYDGERTSRLTPIEKVVKETEVETASSEPEPVFHLRRRGRRNLLAQPALA